MEASKNLHVTYVEMISELRFHVFFINVHIIRRNNLTCFREEKVVDLFE